MKTFSEIRLTKDLSVPAYDNHVVELGTVANEGILLQTPAYKAVFPVDIELLVVGNYLRGSDGLEASDLGFPLPPFAEFIQQVLVVGNGIVCQVFQVVQNLLEFLLQVAQHFVGLEGVVFGNAFNPDLGEAKNVVSGDFAIELLLIWLPGPCLSC